MICDSLEDNEARKHAIYKRRRNSNMILGAVVGGLIDTCNGDDSTVDGFFLGAAFGIICTSSPEEPKAQVGLLFCDGSHLEVEVNKDEYTQLQTLAASNQLEDAGESQSAFSDRNLTLSEVESSLCDRSSNAFMKGVLSAIFIAAMPTILPFLLGILHLEQSLPDIISTSLQFSSALGFITFAGSFLSTRRVESFLMREEQEFYRTLNGKEVAC